MVWNQIKLKWVLGVIAIVVAFPVFAFNLPLKSTLISQQNIQTVRSPKEDSPLLTSSKAPKRQASVVKRHKVVKKIALSSPRHDESEKQTWNLKNADIRAVIRTIALLTNKNFVIDPSVHGKITLVTHTPMTPTELYQVFLSMLQVLHYTAIPSGHVIKIVPLLNAKEYAGAFASGHEPGMGDQVVVRVVPVYNVSAEQMMPVLRPLIKEWGSVSAYGPSNSLILAATAANMQRLISIVHSLDRKNASSIVVVNLRHANAKQMVQVIRQLQSTNRLQGKASNLALAADTENNSILISGNLENIYRMRILIRRLDTPSANGSSNTAVIHLNYLSAKKLAPILTKIANGSMTNNAKGKVSVSGNPSISVQAEIANNAIIIHAPKAMIQNLKTVIRQLDIKPRQVLVEAIIVKVDQSLLNQLGVVWGSDLEQGDTGSNSGISQNQFSLKFSHGIGFIPGGNIKAVVHALLSHGSTDVLATPSIVMLNNQAATISDGKSVGVVNREYSTNTADASGQSVPFNTFQRLPVVLSLKVTPQISPNNVIRLKIQQKDDSLDPNSSDPTNPIINTSKIDTSVLVHSGDILVLGGLINHDQIETVSKVPILGDIPIIGALFRYKNHTVEKKDLMIFIRPVILHNNLDAAAQTYQRYEYVRHEQERMQNGEKLGRNDYPILPAYDHLARLPAPRITTKWHVRVDKKSL